MEIIKLHKTEIYDGASTVTLELMIHRINDNNKSLIFLLFLCNANKPLNLKKF